MVNRFAVATGAAIVLLLSPIADARPPEGGPTPEAPWFRSLKQPNGASCCDMSDCHRLDDNLVRQKGDGWEFLADPTVFGAIGDGHWHDIPEQVLIRGQALARLGGNPTGRWVVCAMKGGYMGQGDPLVLCAVPPSGV